MKIVKENINEEFEENTDPIKDMGIGRPKRQDVIVDVYFDMVISHLRNSIYPQIHNEDDLYALNVKLKDWFDKNV